MAYRDFKLSDLENTYGIVQRQVHLFNKIMKIRVDTLYY